MRFAAIVCAALLCGIQARAGAPAMEIAPTTLDIKADEPGLFYVANRGTEPVTAQIEALDWTQTSGADQLTPSRTLFASPPFATIAPGQRQTVRVLSTDASSGAEIPHRLRVSQLPETDTANGVHILLQFSIPVFVGSVQNAPSLAWDAIRRTDGVALSIHNTGPSSVKLEGLLLTGSRGTAAPVSQGMLYVLPGATREVVFKDWTSRAGESVHVAGLDMRSATPVAADFILHR